MTFIKYVTKLLLKMLFFKNLQLLKVNLDLYLFPFNIQLQVRNVCGAFGLWTDKS